MKTGKFIKSKKFWNSIVIGVSVGACVIAVPSIIIPSWLKYKEYYDSIIAEREHQKYLDSLPLELKGISAKLRDETYYYANGKAVAQPHDFEVTAHFTEKGKDFEKLLFDTDFQVSTAEDFALNGGKVLISYSYTYELEEGETEPKVDTKTAEVNVSLTDVALTKLEVVENPFKIYYREGEKFDHEGFKGKAYYNDGSVINITDLDLDKESETTLAAGTKEVKVTYNDGKSNISTSLPITVKTQAEYDVGTITEINSAKNIEAKEGDALADLKPLIRATYTNGNRLIISDSLYNVVGNVENASFMNNCVLSVSLKENFKITCGVKVKVRAGIQIEDSALTGGTKKEVDAYKMVDNIPVKDGKTTVIEGMTTSKVTIKSEKVAKTNFFIKLSNRTLSKDGTKVEPIKLSKVMSIKVNGRIYPVDVGLNLPGNSEPLKYIFNEIPLQDIVLNKGENIIELSFNYGVQGDLTPNIAIDDLALSTVYDGEIYNNILEVLESNNPDKETTLDVTRISEWSTVTNAGAYGHAIANDGKFLYVTYTSYSDVERNITVVKIDPTNGNVVAKSAKTEKLFKEASAGITIFDDKLIIYTADGTKKFATSLSGFKEGSVFEEYDGLNFEGLEKSVINDVYYNESKELFCVYYDLNSAAIFDKEYKLVKRIAIANDSLGHVNRMTGSEDHIFFNYTKNGTYTPVIHTYDWEGNEFGRTVMPVTKEDLGEVVQNTANTNSQGLTYFNGSFIFSLLKFSVVNGGDQTGYFKIDYRGVEKERALKLTSGEYLAACVDYHNVPPVQTATPVTGSTGAISDVEGWAMAGVSDGEYLYVSHNVSGNSATKIFKVDPETYEVIAESKVFNTGISGSADNSRLFIKDGSIYCLIGNNKIMTANLSKFVEGSALEEATLPFDKVIEKIPEENTLKGIYFDKITRSYGIIDTAGNLYFVKEDGTIFSQTVLKNNEGYKFSSISGDDKYLYVSYSANNQDRIPVEMYAWDGSYVSNSAITGINLDTDYNIQSIFLHNETMYAVVCSWFKGYSKMMLWKVENDLSIFEKDYLSDLKITSMPSKLSYKVGEGFDTTGLVVEAIYNDGEKRKEVTNYTVSPAIFLEPGKQKVTISYTEGAIVFEQQIEVEVYESLSLGDYLISTDAPEFKVNAVNNSFGRINSGGYSMGGASDGTYLYLAQNVKGNGSTRILKVDPAQGYKTLATSQTFETGIEGTKDNSRVFIKDGKLYCFVNDGDIRSIALTDIKDGCELTKDTSLPFNNVPNSKTIVDAEYNESKKMYAVLNTGALYLVNGEGGLVKTINTANDDNLGITNQKVSSVTSDDKYIYVSYKADNQREVLIKTYTWDGEFVKSCAPHGIALEKDGYNTQAIFVHNGVFYAALCTWSNTGGYYLWSISF